MIVQGALLPFEFKLLSIMKKRFISFVAFYAQELGDLMNDAKALEYVYADYRTWFYINNGDEDYDVNASIQAWIIDTAINEPLDF